MINNDESVETSLTTSNHVKIQTYVFEDTKAFRPSGYSFKTKIWQTLPAFSAYLICFAFGIMVGWCSPMYPNLLQKGSEIPIDMDASAMIAGFLMIGNMFGTLPAHFVPFGSKYGIASAGRFLIGFGNSFGTHHGKEYIKQMAEGPVKTNIAKSVQIYIGFGILAGFCFGPHVEFRTYSVIALIIVAVICGYSLFLPHSPTELIQYDKMTQAETVLSYLKPGADIDKEMKEIQSNLENRTLDIGTEVPGKHPQTIIEPPPCSHET
ncbi:hypothetical protein Trydic_g13876 [Trypoxylus dichotomus]